MISTHFPPPVITEKTDVRVDDHIGLSWDMYFVPRASKVSRLPLLALPWNHGR
jgi:hypothetical protein